MHLSSIKRYAVANRKTLAGYCEKETWGEESSCHGMIVINVETCASYSFLHLPQNPMQLYQQE